MWPKTAFAAAHCLLQLRKWILLDDAYKSKEEWEEKKNAQKIIIGYALTKQKLLLFVFCAQTKLKKRKKKSIFAAKYTTKSDVTT
jgi:hypothetical protein